MAHHVVPYAGARLLRIAVSVSVFSILEQVLQYFPRTFAGTRGSMPILISGSTFGVFPSAWLVVTGTAAWIVWSYLRNMRVAPGPRRLPLLGNLLQVPMKMPWLRFTEWSQQYGDFATLPDAHLRFNPAPTGPIFSLDIQGQHIVVVNTHKAAADLFGTSVSL